MLLFRRKPKGRDDPGGEPVAEEPERAPSASASAAADVSDPSAAPPPGEAPPPPLPSPSPGAPAAGTPTGLRSRCFVCGAPLRDGACPTCRITWVE